MDNYIICIDGIAFMSLCKNKEILISESLTRSSYWNLPSSIILNIGEYAIIPNNKNLKDKDIINYIHDCELKVDIISDNSICLRLYKKDIKHECEDDIIGFKITQKKLLRIAKKYLTL